MCLKCSSLALTHELSCTHNTTVYYMLLYHQAVESAREDTMAEMSSASGCRRLQTAKYWRKLIHPSETAGVLMMHDSIAMIKTE